MREAVLWTERGRNVSEDDLNAMLEGREDLSEVQENPFAEMMKEDEATENAQAPAEGTSSVVESAPETSAPTTETVAEETSAPVAEETPVEEIASPEARNDVNEEPVEETPAEEPQPSDNMTDEEFEAFMKKAQAFYDSQASENGIASSPTAPRNDETGDDDDDFPNIEVHSSDN
jgi:hypothetical protein